MTHLENLPVLSEIFSYLPKVYVRDVCNFSLTCITIRTFFTSDKSLQEFWYQMLLRAGHRKFRQGFDFMSLTSCYKTKLNPASFYFIRGLQDIRMAMGECQNKNHLRYRMDSTPTNLSERDLYKELQCVMWRRNRSKYWSLREQKKLCQMQGDIRHLESRRKAYERLEGLYEDMTKEETRRLRKLQR
jgi:hypothetical protein